MRRIELTDDQIAELEALASRGFGADDIAAGLEHRCGVRISPPTVRRRLHELGWRTDTDRWRKRTD